MKYFLSLALLACFLSVHSQNERRIDSLIKTAEAEKVDTEKVRLYFFVASEYYQISNYFKAHQYIDSFVSISKRCNYIKGIQRGYNLKGNSFLMEDKYIPALEEYVNGMKLSEKEKDTIGMAHCFINMGIVYCKLKDTVAGLKSYLKALQYHEQMHYKAGIANAYNSLGNFYNNENKHEKALSYFVKALGNLDIKKHRRQIADLYNNIAATYRDLKNYDRALEFFEKAIEIKTQDGNISGLATTYMNLALLYKMSGKVSELEKSYLLALGYAEKTENLQVANEASIGLSVYYEEVGQHLKSLQHLKNAYALRDTIFNSSSTKSLLRIQMNYEYEKKEALTKLEAQKQVEIERSEKKKQRLILWGVFGFLILVLIFSFFLFKSFRQKKKDNIAIHKQKDIIEEKQKEILDSISYAKRIQEAIIPTDALLKSYLPESFILYKPKDIVAGDFYWLENVTAKNKEEIVLIAVADCTGHGVPGAMVSVVCSNALNRSVKEFGLTNPGKILDKTRELVLETFAKSNQDVKDGMDISLAAISKVNGNVIKINWAGANNPLWFIKDDLFNEIKAHKQSIGKVDNPTPFPVHEIELSKNDSIYLLTDGFADQFGGPKQKKFKYKHLKETLYSNHQLSMNDQQQKLTDQFEDWKSSLEQVDDVCIIGIRF